MHLCRTGPGPDLRCRPRECRRGPGSAGWNAGVLRPYGRRIAIVVHDARRGQARRLLPRISSAAAAWGLCYPLYRGYYALGGTVLLPGTPVPDGPFRRINAAAAVMLGVAAILPLAVLRLW